MRKENDVKKPINKTNDQRLTLRVSKEFLEQIKQKAEENELSVSAYVRQTLKRDIKGNK